MMPQTQTRLAQASFATMVAHGRSTTLFTTHPTISPSTNSPEFIASINTVLRLAKDAGDMLNGVPYVKALAGIIVQIIEIRDVC